MNSHQSLACQCHITVISISRNTSIFMTWISMHLPVCCNYLQWWYQLMNGFFFLGRFIYQNYWQALEPIQINTPCLAALSMKLGISREDYKCYLELEYAYLMGLRTKPQEVKAMADYMEQLFELDNLRYIYLSM